MFFYIIGSIQAICALFFFIYGIKLLFIKDDKFIALTNKWNWMASETERAAYLKKYNIKNVARFNAWSFIISSLFIGLLSATHFMDFGRVGEVIPLLFIPLLIVFIVYFKKSKKLRNI